MQIIKSIHRRRLSTSRIVPWSSLNRDMFSATAWSINNSFLLIVHARSFSPEPYNFTNFVVFHSLLFLCPFPNNVKCRSDVLVECDAALQSRHLDWIGMRLPHRRVFHRWGCVADKRRSRSSQYMTLFKSYVNWMGHEAAIMMDLRKTALTSFTWLVTSCCPPLNGRDVGRSCAADSSKMWSGQDSFENRITRVFVD